MARTPANAPDRKRLLIEAVIDEVVEHGIANTSTTTIGRAANISKSVIHYHFKSMDDLYAAAFDIVMREAGEHMRSRVLYETEPEARLAQMVWGALPLTDVGRRRSRFWFNVLAEALNDPRLLDIQNRYTSTWLAFLARELAALQQNGTVRAEWPPARLADAIVAFADGLTFRMVFGPGITQADLEQVVGWFIGNLRAPSFSHETLHSRQPAVARDEPGG